VSLPLFATALNLQATSMMSMMIEIIHRPWTSTIPVVEMVRFVTINNAREISHQETPH